MSTALRRLSPSTLVRNAPIAVPQALGLLALVVLSAAEGGYPLSDWGPAAVLIELLLVVSLAALPVRRRPYGSRAPMLFVTAFAVWTGLSILWADDRGAAAEATIRTALLAATFVLCARWRHTPRTAAAIVALLTGGLGIIAWGVLVRLHGATDLDPWFLYDRLLEPVGYVNAGAAFFGVTAFLGLGLLGGNLPAQHRLVGALTAVPAASLSLLCLSRGGLIAAALVVILMLALLPGRARNGTAVALAGVGLLIALPTLLDVGDAVRYDADAITVLRAAIVKVFVGTAITTLATWVWIAAESRVPQTDPVRTQTARLGAGIIGLLAVVAVFAAVTERGPVTVGKIRHAVDTITRPYAEQPASESRLTAGLNSGRWDFWTVAWHQFEDHPLLGAGADNYRQDYLIHGKSLENPTYPHSLELRTLGQLGLVGGVLLLGWILGVLVAIRRLASGPDRAGRGLAVAAAGAFGMWLVHGSGDWLMEYGGFSAIVAAVAGLAVAAAPDRWAAQPAADPTEAPADPDPDPSPADADRGGPVEVDPAEVDGAARRRPRRLPPVGVAAGVALLLLAAGWTSAAWIADRDIDSAALIGDDQPTRALDRANVARSLSPFGERADMLLGSLAITRGDLPAARAAYRRAHERNPRAARPRMWLGVLASASGDRRQAVRWLRAARRAAPRDALVELLLGQVDAGTTLSPRGVTSQLAGIATGLTQDPDPVRSATPTTPGGNTPAPGASTPPATDAGGAAPTTPTTP